jgi:hypothetical protein
MYLLILFFQILVCSHRNMPSLHSVQVRIYPTLLNKDETDATVKEVLSFN